MIALTFIIQIIGISIISIVFAIVCVGVLRYILLPFILDFFDYIKFILELILIEDFENRGYHHIK